jgi:flagellar biosynthesis protein FlhF
LLVRTGLLPVFAERVVAETSPLSPHTNSLHSEGRGDQSLATQIELISDTLRRQWKGDATRSQAGVHVFVGVPGAGKSTVLCKMLAQASLAEAQPASIYQLDTLVANNSPQPALFSEILGGHFERTLPSQFEWSEQSVFIDLPGIGLGDTRGLEALSRTIQTFGVPEIHLVLNAAYESAHLLEQARFFSKLEISDLFITHLDEEQRWGKIWNLVLGTNYSVRFLSAGQNVPGEFFPATADAVLNRQFGAK